MKTLVFDTCFNKTYIVLSDNEKIIKSEIIESDEKNYHSAYLIPKIRDILCANNLLVKDINAIGVNIGPGSFTGIRAGITIARVLAQQFNIKLIGTTSLEILSHINKEKTHTTVVLDARKNKVYFGEYQQNKTLLPPCLKDKEELISDLKQNTFIISDSSIGDFLKQTGVNSLNYEEANDNLGLYLSEIVYSNLNDNAQDYNWAKVKPLYIQKPSITKPKEKSNVL